MRTVWVSAMPEPSRGLAAWASLCVLDLTQVEGLVSIKSLGNEWFEFDEDALTLTGADTGAPLRVGPARDYRGLARQHYSRTFGL